jgi:hypothetical protein
MPGDRSDGDHVSVVANSVMLKQLMEDYEEDLEDEDY